MIEKIKVLISSQFVNRNTIRKATGEYLQDNFLSLATIQSDTYLTNSPTREQNKYTPVNSFTSKPVLIKEFFYLFTDFLFFSSNGIVLSPVTML